MSQVSRYTVNMFHCQSLLRGVNSVLICFIDDHHHAVDPACGAALAAVYHPQGLHDLQQQGKLPTPLHSVVVIVCGGHGVNIELLNKWKKDFGL